MNLVVARDQERAWCTIHTSARNGNLLRGSRRLLHSPAINIYAALCRPPAGRCIKFGSEVCPLVQRKPLAVTRARTNSPPWCRREGRRGYPRSLARSASRRSPRKTPQPSSRWRWGTDAVCGNAETSNFTIIKTGYFSKFEYSICWVFCDIFFPKLSMDPPWPK